MNDTCPTCKGVMKPLFTGSYCPKDCDRPRSGIVVTGTVTLHGYLNTFVWNKRRWGIRRVTESKDTEQSWKSDRAHIDAMVADPIAYGQQHWRTVDPPGMRSSRTNALFDLVVFDDLGPA